jgi:branched-chain amino acid transport system ATP-binding protein
LLDEPAGGLGADDMEHLGGLIRELPDAGDAPCSVLLVEHHMDLVMGVCDQVVVLDFGRLVAAGTPDDVRADPVVAAAYLGTDVPAEAGA